VGAHLAGMEDAFWMTLAAVLCANLLTVAFVYAAFSMSKLEREKKSIPAFWYLGALVPFLFIGLGYFGLSAQ
jgi:ABC-type Fe3+ transport system permease subunit